MDHNAGSNEVGALRIDQTRWEKMEIVSDAIRNDGVAGIVPSLSSGAELDRWAEDIDEFSFAFVAPLSADHNCSHDVFCRIESVQMPAEMTSRGIPECGYRNAVAQGHLNFWDSNSSHRWWGFGGLPPSAGFNSNTHNKSYTSPKPASSILKSCSRFVFCSECHVGL